MHAGGRQQNGMREALTEQRHTGVEPRNIDQHARTQGQAIEAFAIPPDRDLVGSTAAHAFERLGGQSLLG